MSMFGRLLPRRQDERNVPEDTAISELRDDFHRAVDEMFRRAWMDPFGSIDMPFMGTLHPRVDMHEDDDNLYVHAEIPGMRPEELDVRIDRDDLVIRGEKKQEHKSEERGVHRQERSYGSFMRRIALPCEVAEDRVQARYEHGVLELTLPKSERAKSRTRRIEVRGS